MADAARSLIDAVVECRERQATLAIVGHGSKPALGEARGEQALSTVEHCGILDYRPDELVVTARAGTPLAELADALAEHGQALPFEPPRFNGLGTLGGAVASGLSGPARPWRGSVRDAVLGVEIVNGMGERLRFGGSVMKNVAGYDVSRLMAGAQGTLGVILSASVRVAPRPPAEESWRLPCSVAEAGEHCRRWARLPLPVSATCWVEGVLSVRLSGSAAGIASARRTMQLEQPQDSALWATLRDHRHGFFTAARAATRLSLPRGNRYENSDALVEWGGCQAWLPGAHAGLPLPAGGFATIFGSNAAPSGLDAAAAKYARRLRRAFDPHGIFSPPSN